MSTGRGPGDDDHWRLDPALARIALGATRDGRDARAPPSITSALRDAWDQATGERDLSDPGQRMLGDYELLELIGQGGMGMVYRAREHRLEREVAIKLLCAGSAAAEGLVETLRSEARHAARLQHPNIVTVYEMGEHDGLIFYAMQLVDGSTLSQQIDREGPLTPHAAARLLRVLAEAVDYAHRVGVLHLDLKPGNVLIDAAGTPLIADFGLARPLDQHDVADVSGTPGYMAPEQVRPGGAPLSPATDVWALGAICHEVLTGKPPFQADDDEAMATLVLEAPATAPSAQAPAVPPDLDAICLHCLHKDPAQRYPDARALADDLGRFLEGRAVTVRPLDALQRATRWARREPRVAAGIALTALSLVVGVAATSLQWQRAESNAQAASSRLWDSRRESARRAAMEGNGHDALPRLMANIEELERERGPDAARLDRRRLGLLVRQGAQLVDSIAVADANPLALELSPDGSVLAVAFNDLSVRWYDASDLSEQGRVSLRGRASADGGTRVPILLRFAGDSTLRVTLHWFDNLASPADGNTWLIDLPRRRVVEPPAAFADFADATYSADARLALLRNRRRHVQLWEVSPWRALSALVDPGDGATSDFVSWQVGGPLSVSLPGAQQRLDFHRMPRITPAGSLSMPNAAGVSAWNRSHDGRWLALGNFDGQVYLLDIARQDLRTLSTSRGREVTWVEFSGDGAWLAAGSADGAAHAFDVASGQALVSGQMRHDFPLQRVGIDRRHRLLVAAGEGRTCLWRIPEAGPRTAPAQRIGLGPAPFGTSGRYATGWSFRNGLLATAGIDGRIRLWRMPLPPTLPARAPRQIPDGIQYDGRRIVDVEWNRLRLYSPSDGTATPWLALPTPPGFAELVEGGRTLVVTVGAHLHVYSARDMRPRFAPLPLPASPQRFLASPQGTRLLLGFGGRGQAGFEDRLRQYDLQRGVELPGTARLRGPLRQLAYSRDGSRLLAVGPADAATDVLAGTDLAPLAQYPHDPFQPVAWAAFASAGSGLLLATRAPDARLGEDLLVRWNVDGDTIDSQRSLGGLQPLVVTAQGDRAYVGGLGAGLLFNGAGEPRSIPQPSGSEATAVVASSPDGRFIAQASRRDVQLIDARSGALVGPPLQADIDALDVMQQLAFSPDGQQLLGRSLHGRWLLWPIAANAHPIHRLQTGLRLATGVQDRPGRLRAPTGAERRALRTGDPGPWPIAGDRPRIPARHHANRNWRAGSPLVDRGPIPERTWPPASTPQLDLAAAYNRSPDGVQLPFYSTRTQLRPYPAGLQRVNDVDFDVRGMLVIGRGEDVDINLPGATCVDTPDMHAGAAHALLLPGVRQPVDRPVTVGRLTWNYLDGSHAVTPIRILHELPGFSGRDQAVPIAFGISLATQAHGLHGEVLSAPRLPNPTPSRTVREICFAVVGTSEPLSILAVTLEGAVAPPLVGKPVIEDARRRIRD